MVVSFLGLLFLWYLFFGYGLIFVGYGLIFVLKFFVKVVLVVVVLGWLFMLVFVLFWGGLFLKLMFVVFILIMDVVELMNSWLFCFVILINFKGDFVLL